MATYAEQQFDIAHNLRKKADTRRAASIFSGSVGAFITGVVVKSGLDGKNLACAIDVGLAAADFIFTFVGFSRARDSNNAADVYLAHGLAAQRDEQLAVPQPAVDAPQIIISTKPQI